MEIKIDDRDKECEYCGAEFRDNTRPKNKKTCSKECAQLIKNGRQRAEYRIENPPQPNQRQRYYYNHHEYAFWLDEEIGRNQMWKEAIPYDPDKIEDIASARELESYHGGRKRRQEALSYDGDEKGSHGIRVSFSEHDRKPSEVTSYTMSPEELAERSAKRSVKI